MVGKNLTYGQFWGTNGRPFSREGEVVRSKRGFQTGFISKSVWDRPKSFIQEGCSPDQSVRKAGFYCISFHLSNKNCLGPFFLKLPRCEISYFCAFGTDSSLSYHQIFWAFGAPQTYRGKIRLIVVKISPWVSQYVIHYLSMIQLPDNKKNLAMVYMNPWGVAKSRSSSIGGIAKLNTYSIGGIAKFWG